MKILSLFFLIMLMSEQPDSFNKKKLLGHWSLTEKTENYLNYSKTDSTNNKVDLILKKNNELIVRTIVRDGFCGTPPHSYRSNPGTWKLKGKMLTLEYEYTPRLKTNIIAKDGSKPEKTKLVNNYKIIKLDDNNLQVKLM